MEAAEPPVTVELVRASPPQRMRKFLRVVSATVIGLITLTVGGYLLYWWLTPHFRQLAEFPDQGLRNVFFFPDGKRFGVIYDADLSVWDIKSRTHVGQFCAGVDATALSPDGRTLYAAKQFGYFEAYDIRNLHRPLRRYDVREGQWYTCLAVSHDGRWLAAGTHAGELAIVDLQTDGAVQVTDTKVTLYSLAILRDPIRIASVHSRGTRLQVRLVQHETPSIDLDLAQGMPKGTDFRGTGVGENFHVSVTVSPDQRYLACGASLFQIEPWERVKWPTDQLPAWATASAFTPDSKRLLTGHGDGSLRLWDIATGAEICRTYPYRNETPIHGLAVSPDGQTVLTAGPGTTFTWDDIRWPIKDHYVRLWRIPK